MITSFFILGMLGQGTLSVFMRSSRRPVERFFAAAYWDVLQIACWKFRLGCLIVSPVIPGDLAMNPMLI